MLTSVAALATLGGLAALPSAVQASAAPYQFDIVDGVQDYQCNLPLAARQSVRADVQISPAVVGTYPMQSWEVRATVDADVSGLDALRVAGIVSVGGTAKLTVNVYNTTTPGSETTPLAIPLTIPRTPIAAAPAPTRLSAAGSIPFSRGYGNYRWVLEAADLEFDLKGYDAAGAPVNDAAGLTQCDLQPPTTCEAPAASLPTPSGVSVSYISPTTREIRWNPILPRPCGTAVVGYQVFVNGELRGSVGPTATTFGLTGLERGTEYTVTVKAVGVGGSVSEASTPVIFQTDVPPICLAVVAQAPVVSELTPTSARVTWIENDPGFCGVDRVGFKVYVDGVETQTVTDPAATLTGLTPATQYAVTVRAFDAAGKLSPSSGPARITTPAPPQPRFKYDLSGTSQLRTLTRGAVPVTGSIEGGFDAASGALEADLALNATRARLTVLGAIPVTAQIAFVPSGLTTGTLVDGALTTNSKVKIRLPQIYLFGAIPIAGTSSCQTRRISDVPLKSVGAFDAATGGRLAGTFAISDLTGCGALNGLISPLVAGAGNTLTLDLTKA